MVETVVIRHARERLSKCSLHPIEGHAGLRFFKAKGTFSFEASGYTILAVDAPVLSPADAVRPLLLLDSTWKLLPTLEARLQGEGVRRSLPSVQTAYPRVNKQGLDPLAGLASVEALYLAQRVLGHDEPSLLAHYHWREAFLENVRQAGL